MKIRDIITEAPLADYQPLGDFNKPGPFRAVDKRLITHPTTQLKTARFLENTPYDFRLFFSNISGTAVTGQESGAADAASIIKKFGPTVGQQILDGHEDAITVVFLGNSGADKVMMTPWIMAHRLGHSVQGGIRSGKGGHAWKAVEEHFFRTVNGFLTDFYARPIRTPAVMTGSMTPEYNALFNTIGTQRSSRTGQITRPYEFIYEMFAQYIKTGHVTLNALPARVGYGYQAWGHQTRHLVARPEYHAELANAADTLANDMTILFSDVLAECQGQVFFM